MAATISHTRGGPFRRGQILYVSYYDHTGARRQRSTGLGLDRWDEAQAEYERLTAESRQRFDRSEPDAIPESTWTVGDYARRWIREREGSRSIASYQTAIDNYVIPQLGRVVIADLRVRHARALIGHLKRQDLAPRSIVTYMAIFRSMLEDAIADEVLISNPARNRVLRKHLPKAVDRDPDWRAQAKYTIAEVELLIASPPAWEAVLYSVLFLGGVRPGEAFALTFRRWIEREPLDALSVVESRSSRRGKLEPTKTGIGREVPIHPALRAVLADWRSHGFARVFGRVPGPADLICPFFDPSHPTTPRPWRADTARKHLQATMADLGIRPGRTLREMRRSMVSFARNGGADRDTIKWATHGRGASIIDGYTEMEWSTLCAAVSAIPIVPKPQPSDQLALTGLRE